MEPPLPPTQPPPSSAVTPYPDSVDSSPRSRNNGSYDETLHSSIPTPKLRLMCSYGGHIVPRPHDKSLCYIGGDTRIVVVDKHTSLSDLSYRLYKTLLRSNSSSSSPPQQQQLQHLFTLKYQLPNEDLDSLISVTTDEDLENMIDEYERLSSGPTANRSSSSRLRLFLFPNNVNNNKAESVSCSIGSLLENSSKSEDWFLNALNGANINATSNGFSDSSSVNCLLGLDDDVFVMPTSTTGLVQKDVKGGGGGGGKSLGGGGGQDVHSVPDSPMLETSSSFGSASSSPPLVNLPPIRVHVADVEDQKVGEQKQDDRGFAAMSSPPAVPMSVQQPSLIQPQAQLQPKQSNGFDQASPDSVSSDGSLTNPLSIQKPPLIYQDQIVRTATPPTNTIDQNNNPDQNNGIHLQQQHQHQQQIQDSGYLLPTQFDPQHTQLHQQPQFIHASSQYIHHHPSGAAVPIQSYYQMYPSQQQQHPHHSVPDQQNFVYYVPARAPQGYNISLQQPSYNEASATTRSQNMAPASSAYNPARNVASSQPELVSGVYRTGGSGNPQLVQIPSNQHQAQYVGYSQVHHPSQSVGPPPSTATNYGYEYTDPPPGHMYYAQPMPPQSAAQYQTMVTNLPDAAGNLLSSENVKQQVRTSQPT